MDHICMYICIYVYCYSNKCLQIAVYHSFHQVNISKQSGDKQNSQELIALQRWLIQFVYKQNTIIINISLNEAADITKFAIKSLLRVLRVNKRAYERAYERIITESDMCNLRI